MRKQEDLDDYFDMDSTNYDKIPSNQIMNQNQQFPLRIGTNFFEGDSESFSNDNQNKSFDDILNQRIANQRSVKQDAKLKYPNEQIMKINKINKNIKSIVVLENQLKLKFKNKLIKLAMQNKSFDKELKVRKNFSQVIKKLVVNFQQTLSQKIEHIKFERISKITPQKRSYYLNLMDQKEMVKRKFIKTLIAEKDIQLLKKRGKLQNQQTLKDMKATTNMYIHYITKCASSIHENRMSESMNRTIKSDFEQLAKQMKNHTIRDKQTMVNLNNEISKKVGELLQTQEIVNNKKLKKQIDLEAKIISSSQNLLEIVPPKRLFSLMPTFNRQSFLKI